MFSEKINQQDKSRFRLSDHPWISLVVLWIIGIFSIILVVIAANWVGVPGDTPYRPLITPTVAHILVMFLIVPFVLRLPMGKTTFRKYLDDIRLSHIRPFIPLLLLGISCSLIMLLCLSVNSFIYRLAQGQPITLSFIRYAVNFRSDIFLQSWGWINTFPCIFEEVSWRGVILVMFMKKYSANGIHCRFFLWLRCSTNKQLVTSDALSLSGEYVHLFIHILFSAHGFYRNLSLIFNDQSSLDRYPLDILGQVFL